MRNGLNQQLPNKFTRNAPENVFYFKATLVELKPNERLKILNEYHN